MIEKITKIFQLHSINVKHYNSSLPLEILIMQKIKNGYLIKLGNKVIEARSAQPMQIGAKYWVHMNENNNEIILSNIFKQPKITSFLERSPLVLESMNEKNILEFIAKMKENIFEALINAKDRDEFLLLNTMLLGMSKGIISIVINQNNRRCLAQIRFKKKIEFSAVFANLGVINGVLYEKHLLLSVQYESVKKILQKNANKLEGFSLDIIVSPKIEIMQDIFEDSLLVLEA